MTPPLDRSSRRGAGRVAFLAAVPDIRVELEAGWSLRVVYDGLKETNRMPISYPQFTEYVRRYITQEPAKQVSSGAPQRQAGMRVGASKPTVPTAPVLPPRTERRPGEPVSYNPRPASELLAPASKPTAAPES